MAGPLLYSTNPWLAHELTRKYRDSVYFAWVSEYFDAATAPPGSAAAAIAPSSNPKQIYENLWADYVGEDNHSSLIKNYRKTFKRLAVEWRSAGHISEAERKEIVATIDSNSWRIWRPVLYVIPRALITPDTRLKSVTRKDRAAYGPELQIADLKASEFDILELRK